MWWLIGSTPDCRGCSTGFESSSALNALRDHCVIPALKEFHINRYTPVCRCPVSERCRGCPLGGAKSGPAGEQDQQEEEEELETLLKPSDRLALRLTHPDKERLGAQLI